MGISIWKLLIVLGIVILVFGTKRLKSLGADLGDALKNFRQAIKEGEDNKPPSEDNKPQLETRPPETLNASKVEYTAHIHKKDEPG